jgi:hypothetical protein
MDWTGFAIHIIRHAPFVLVAPNPFIIKIFLKILWQPIPEINKKKGEGEGASSWMKGVAVVG